MELYAELVGRDGSRRPFQVGCERTLKGLVSGLEQLKGDVSEVLSDLVLQEKGERNQGGKESGGDEENDDEEDDEEDTEKDKTENGTCSNGPPTKRTKTHKD
ncbi:EKC/KEOPS complex subunit GON7 [Discoglossus pictus]